MALNNLVELKYKCTGGDEISHYDTIYAIKAPLYKYITEILKTNEWGYINIEGKDIKLKLEYSHGKSKTNLNVIFNIKDRLVNDASYSGGWSRGDWTLYIEEEGDKMEINKNEKFEQREQSVKEKLIKALENTNITTIEPVELDYEYLLGFYEGITGKTPPIDISFENLKGFYDAIQLVCKVYLKDKK